MASAVMEYIRANAVFTTEELLGACGDTQNSRNLLHLAKKAGRARQVKRGLYASNAGRFEGARPPFQLVAAMAAVDSTLCYASAFSLFLGNQDVLTEAPFYTASRMKPFEFDGVRYVPLPMPESGVEAKGYLLYDGQRVQGTTREQTVADSLSNVERGGGAEAVLRRLSALQRLDAAKTAGMLAARGPSACARLGWVLERKAGEWGVDASVIDGLRHAIGEGPYYFGPASAKRGFDRVWRLYLPEDENVMEGWLNG